MRVYCRDFYLEAVEKTSKNHELGTFLIQECATGSDSYTANIYLKVVSDSEDFEMMEKRTRARNV